MWLTMQDFWKLIKILSILIAFVVLSCMSAGEKAQVITGQALGTTYQVKFYHQKNLDLKKGMDSIFDVINSSMSTYQPDSDISRINSGDSTIVVDRHFQRVFQDSKKIYEESRGYFDPTVGNLVNAYGFGPEKGHRELSETKLDSMMQYVGLDKLQLTEDNRLVKEASEIYLDFNAIAKGYVVDVMGAYLQQKQVDNFLIELGGELLAKGHNLEKHVPWVVGIDDPGQSSEQRVLTAALRLENRGMASSGNYRKFRVDSLTGNSYVHTINPLTGRSQRSDLLSATVLAPTCALADGYATAFISMGFHNAIEMLKRIEGVDVYFIYAGVLDEIKIFSTPGFEAALIGD